MAKNKNWKRDFELRLSRLRESGRIRVFKVKGRDQEFIGIGSLAYLSGRTPEGLRLLERKGILPQANFRVPEHSGVQWLQANERMYTVKFVPTIVELLCTRIPAGRKTPPEVAAEFGQVFRAEREYITNTNPHADKEITTG